VQRVPPTEKRGRTQTSTTTVAVLREPEEAEVYLNPADLELKTTRGSGPGGQARNKTESCVVLTHKPTRTVVRVDSERSQVQNKRLAFGLLRSKILEAKQCAQNAEHAALRKAQLGGGARGDKRRTIAIQRDQVVDHVLGIRTTYTKYVKGVFDGVW
jgi:peptide chain release factor 1